MDHQRECGHRDLMFRFTLVLPGLSWVVVLLFRTFPDSIHIRSKMNNLQHTNLNLLLNKNCSRLCQYVCSLITYFHQPLLFIPFAISMKSSLSLSLFQVTIVSSLTFNPQMDDEVSKVRILDRSPLATNILHSLIVIISFGFCLQIFWWFPRRW